MQEREDAVWMSFKHCSAAVVDLSKWLAIMEIKFVLYARAKHEGTSQQKKIAIWNEL